MGETSPAGYAQMGRNRSEPDGPAHLSSRIILVPVPGPDEGALVGLLATEVANIRELTAPPPAAGPPSASLGPAVADGETILRVLDPDRFLAFAAPPALAACSP